MADWYEKRRFGDLPREAARRWGEREALVFQGRRWSFRELADDVDRAAKALLALGVAPGEKVGLWLPNRPEWIHLMFALARVGAVQIPINTRLRSQEIGYVLGQSDSGTLITCEQSGPARLLDVVRGVLPGLEAQRPEALDHADFPHLRRIVTVGGGAPGTVSWEDLLARGAAVPDAELEARAAAVHPDDPLFIMYTSGTTGFPKGVVHTHNIVRNVEDRANRMAITPADTILMFLPLFHIFAYGEGPVSSVISGARQVLTATFDADESLDLLEAERATVTYAFDTHAKDLLDAQARRARDVSSLRTAFVVAGMHSSTPVARRFNEVFCPTISGFGMTECYVGAALGFPGVDTLEQRTEASGYPAPGYEFRVVDPDTGAERPTGEPGELWVRGYGVMEGYYNKPEETAKALTPDGWLRSGDMAVLRPDGYLRFMGRYKDMLKVGGENVDPMEVEGFLLEHPAVQQVAVVAYPDERLGEVPVAFVQPRDASPPPPEELVAHCKGRIAGFKVPRHVLYVEELPMTSSGKVQKVKLREQALDRLQRTPPKAGG